MEGPMRDTPEFVYCTHGMTTVGNMPISVTIGMTWPESLRG